MLVDLTKLAAGSLA